MTGAFNDLLDLAAHDAGTLRLTPGRHDIWRLLDESAAMFAPQAAARGQRLVVKRPPAPPAGRALLEAHCDAERVAQILSNLIGNALKFTPRGGTVTLEATKLPATQQISVSVSDSGPGVPPQERELVFERHWRAPCDAAAAPASRASDGHGHGLGLFIVRELVRAHGGTVAVDGGEGGAGGDGGGSGGGTGGGSGGGGGGGARFTFTLPAFPSAPAALNGPHARRARPTILVVDDDPDIVDVVSDVLQHAGYAVLCAGDGVEALELLRHARAEPVSLVVLDVSMPRMNGIEFRRRQLDDAVLARIPTLAMSAMADALEQVPVDPAARLLKPLSTDALLALVRRLLDDDGAAAGAAPGVRTARLGALADAGE